MYTKGGEKKDENKNKVENEENEPKKNKEGKK